MVSVRNALFEKRTCLGGFSLKAGKMHLSSVNLVIVTKNIGLRNITSCENLGSKQFGHEPNQLNYWIG